MPKEDVNPSDYAFLEGRILRVESEQRAIRRVSGELAEQVESLTQAVRRLREEGEHWQPWRETTDVRNMRTLETESLRVRAKDAETGLANAKSEMIRRLAWLAPAVGALLYAAAEFVRSFIHH